MKATKEDLDKTLRALLSMQVTVMCLEDLSDTALFKHEVKANVNKAIKAIDKQLMIINPMIDGRTTEQWVKFTSDLYNELQNVVIAD